MSTSIGIAGFFRRVFASDFMPHGGCFFWRPELLWLHAVSDTLIAAAYFLIPFILFYIVRRRDLGVRYIVPMFATFILACGATHLLAVWNLWHSAYRLEGLVKAITAAASVATAIASMRLAPVVLRMPTPDDLHRVNEALRQEIEARKSAEDKLRLLLHTERLSSEAKIRTYFDAAPQGILAVGPDGRIELTNHRAEEMFGYSRGELIGQDLGVLIPGKFRHSHSAQVADYFQAPRVRAMGGRLTLTGRRKDGSDFPAEVGLSHIAADDGNLALALVSDITERKRAADELARANAELKASEAHLRSLLEAASQGIVTIDAGGRILLVNRRTEEMFGYTREELTGRGIEMLLPERVRARHAEHREAFLAEPRVRPMGPGLTLAGRRKSGTEFPVEIGLSFVETEAGVLAMGMISDISDRQAAADRLARANEQLRRSNEELEQFAYVASHDLQEPLRMITGYLNILQRRYASRLDADAGEFIGYAVDGAVRMKTMIREILALSRMGTQAVTRLHVPAEEIVRAALDNVGASVEESGAEVTVDPLPEVFVDPGLLALAFQNLISNAIKFRGTEAPKIRVSAGRQGSDWIFSVADNGIGIASDHQDRIFRMFERLHSNEEYPGTGVGLAMAKKTVERHGGRIWVESLAGQGATFFFSIPAQDALLGAEI